MQIKENQIIHGFQLDRVTPVNLPKIRLFEFTHTVTKSKYLHIEADDENNCFSVAFRTVPKDSTGIAHILEHVVLCGSKNYDKVNDPFFSMINRSLNTFMNAFTAEDWTMYPFATCNPSDFQNLLRVYLDAAFFPLIREESFMQEGHHFAFAGDDPMTSPLTISGVVFNEMKGAMTSQSNMMTRKTAEALFPSITYHFNSGGDPLEIPKLTHQDLTSFHAHHYHPSNAVFFTYGNMPMTDHMKIIEEEVLSQFDYREVNTTIPLEKRFNTPKQFRFPYAASGNDTQDAFQTATVWLTNPIININETVSMSLLDEMILGNSASALRKALLESSLGKSLSDVAGYENNFSETCFGAGLQGVKEKNIPDVNALVEKKLKEIVSGGIDKRQIESVIHNFELSNRELGTGSYPQGLSYILKVYPFWSNGANPADILDFERITSTLHRNIENDARYFEGLIEKNMLANNHKVEVTLYPQPDFSEKQDQQIAAFLREQEKDLTPAKRSEIHTKFAKLEKMRDEPSDISTLPFLPLTEIQLKKTYADPTDFDSDTGIFRYTADTNGISYFKFIIALPELSEEQRNLLPLFVYLFNKSGTEKYSYDELSLAMNLSTGGIGASIGNHDDIYKKNQVHDYIEISGKALNRNLDKLFDLSEELIQRYTFNDAGRIKNLMSQRFVSMVNSVSKSGHAFAVLAAKRQLSPASGFSEQYRGVSQIAVSAALEKEKQRDFSAVSGALKDLGDRLLASDAVKIFVCSESSALDRVTKGVKKILDSFPKSLSGVPLKMIDHYTPQRQHEAWLFQSPVSYVAKAIPVVPFLHDDAPALFAAANYIESDYIHPEIREKGGAYGGMCNYDFTAGTFSFISYRDPHYKRTLEVFDTTCDWLNSQKITREKLHEAVLTSFGSMDQPQSPVQKCATDFFRRHLGQKREDIQQFRDRLIRLKEEDISRVVAKYLSQKGSYSTLTSEEIFQKEFGNAQNSPVRHSLLAD